MALDLNDKTSNGNNLTNVNTVADVTTSLPFVQSTHAAGFTAAYSQYLYANDSVSLSITGDIFLSCWIKFTTLPSGGNMQLFSKRNEDTTKSYAIAVADVGAGVLKLVLNVSSDGSNNDNHFSDVLTVSTGVWYFFAMNWTASTHSATFYQGDESTSPTAIGTDATGTLTSFYNSAAEFKLGASKNDAGTLVNFLNGQMDDPRVYNVTRTLGAIQGDYNIELVGNEANLVAYWPFETELGGVTITDEYGYFL